MLCPGDGVLRQLAGGLLPDGQGTAIREHIAGCADCTRRWRQVQAEATQPLPATPAPASAEVTQPLAPALQAPAAPALQAPVAPAPSSAAPASEVTQPFNPAPRPEASPAPRPVPVTPAPTAPPFGGELQRGTAIGRYLLLKRIGGGGMGHVYAAYDPELDRNVCLKLLRPDVSYALGGEGQVRLLREAQAMAKLAHPNVVAVHDVGHHGDQLFMAMELVEGGTLRQWLREKPRGWRRVLEAFRAAGEGLAAAHAAGLVHRDFKPDNVLVGEDGRVRVTDFGLVRPSSEEMSPSSAPMLPASLQSMHTPLTEAGVVMGTPSYMPPEQFRGEATDARSDQFSFCVALYEGLYGERPFPGKAALELRAAVESGRVRPAPAGAKVPSWLRAVVLRGLRPSPAERYPDMRALLDELSRDRQKGRARGLTVAAAIALAAGTFGASRLLDARREKACSAGEAQIAAVWSLSQRDMIKNAFAATGVPYAAVAWDNVDTALSRYAADWAAMDADACRATYVRRDQSEEMLGRRRACLARRLAAFKSLAGLFASADGPVVERAAVAAQGLPDLSGCGAMEVLSDPVPPPSDKTLRARVEALRARLAESQVRLVSGRYAEGAERASKVVEEAAAVPFKALSAEALLVLGQAKAQLGDAAEAERVFARALVAAEASGHDAVAARAWTELVLVRGRMLRHFEPGHEAVEHAAAVNERIGADDAARARLLTWEGVLLRAEGRYDDAVDRQRRALALAEKAYGPDHVEVARVLLNLGNVLLELARYSEALPVYTRSRVILEKLLGPDHPNVANVITNLGIALRELGSFDEALANYRQSLAVTEKVYGPDSPDVALVLNNMGAVEISLGRYEEARHHFERALAIQERHPSDDPVDLPLALSNLGVVAIQERDYARALPYCERTVALLEKHLGRSHPTLALHYANLGHALRGLGRDAAARAQFERALAIDEKALGPEHPNLWQELIGLGWLSVRERSPAKARAVLERALKLREKEKTDPSELAETRFALAQALWLSGDRPKALELARAARDGFRTGPTRKPLDLAEVERWLSAHGG